MGACFSLSVVDNSTPSAKVVSINGTLRHYNVPVDVSSVLEAEAAASSSFSSSFFLCNSDFLAYDDFIPELDSKALLYPNQLYFVLPRSKLQNRLTASDMAALAVKASVAIQNESGRRNKKARISPVLAQSEGASGNNSEGDHVMVKSFPGKKQEQKNSPGISRTGSMRRLQKYTSRRAKLAVRSFRLRLSTIHEGTVMLN